MATSRGIVCSVRKIRPHLGADKLEIGELSSDATVVLPKGVYGAGDKLVYLFPGTVVPEAVVEGLPQHKTLKGSNFTVGSAKIRGEVSQGITLPLEVLGEPNDQHVPGFEISAILGLTTKQEMFEAKKELSAAKNLSKKKVTHVLPITTIVEVDAEYSKVTFDWQEGTQQVVMKTCESLFSSKRFTFVPPQCQVDPSTFSGDNLIKRILTASNFVSVPFTLNGILSEGMGLPCGISKIKISKCPSSQILESQKNLFPTKVRIESIQKPESGSPHAVVTLSNKKTVVFQDACDATEQDQVVFFPAGTTVPRKVAEALKIPQALRVVRYAVQNDFLSEGVAFPVSEMERHFAVGEHGELEDMSAALSYSSIQPLAIATIVVAVNSHPNDPKNLDAVVVTPLDTTHHIIVVVNKDSHKVGDTCVFVAPPGIIPSNVSGDSEPTKVEWKVVKGVPSAGRIINLEDLKKSLPELSEKLTNSLPGDDLTADLGITEEIRKLASVVSISELTPHPSRDNLMVASQNGWSTVVFGNEFKAGDLAIYYEIDSVVPDNILKQSSPEQHFGSSLATKSKNVIRSTKIGGILSQGILLPIPEELRGTDLQLGDDVTVRLGVSKYDPAGEAVSAGSTGQIGRFPHGVSKTEAPRIQTLTLDNYKDVQFYITEKLDGSSITCVMRNGDFSVASRNWTVSEDTLHGSAASELGIEKILREANLDNIVLQGELIGPKIGGNRYELSKIAIHFFSVYDLSKVEYYSVKEAVTLIESLGLTWVPFFDQSYFIPTDATKESILLMADGKSLLNPSVEREGLVFRSVDAVVLKDRHIPKVSFKVISNAFLLRFEGMTNEKKKKKDAVEE
eukprot:TRINITY_DN18937_c0_g1_i1.p1 TRINITY_DN18937_c0_g1~~TRINITY_DN18937_c0_g1_i1.p1  ORF type:complete len:860 (+),score=151.97 TRINITY_DN18937_c0_g1_i1:36-2582(+)